jgi:hypothetical protein
MPIGAGGPDLVREACADGDHQRRDDRLEQPESVPLQEEQQHDVEAGDDDAPDERDPEEELQRDRRADHLREVARGDRELAQDPEHERHRPRVVVTARLREVAPGDDPEPHRQVLQEHRHQVGRQDHEEERIAVLRAGGEVGGPVARVHVPHRNHQADPGECPQPAGEGCRARRDGDRCVRLAERRGRRLAPPTAVAWISGQMRHSRGECSRGMTG